MSHEREDGLMASLKKVLFLNRHGLEPCGSVAIQLAETRALMARLRAHEAELVRWARSGDFVLAVPGEPVSIALMENGTVVIVHEGMRKA